MPGLSRDPVSELFDRGSRRLLERAYAARGGWAGTRLADPSPEHRDYFRSQYGIDVDGPDNAPTLSGRRDDAKSRWGRGFVRSLYYQHKWFSPMRADRTWRAERRSVPRSAGAIEVEWGRRMPGAGVIPAGRAIRVRTRAGGQAKMRAVQRMPDRERIWTDEGQPAGRFSLASGRDWA